MYEYGMGLEPQARIHVSTASRDHHKKGGQNVTRLMHGLPRRVAHHVGTQARARVPLPAPIDSTGPTRFRAEALGGEGLSRGVSHS